MPPYSLELLTQADIDELPLTIIIETTVFNTRPKTEQKKSQKFMVITFPKKKRRFPCLLF